MEERITLDMLTQTGVSVKKQRILIEDGVEYEVGHPHRKAYINSLRGRQEVIDELPEPQRNAIFAVWGPEPTVQDQIDSIVD